MNLNRRQFLAFTGALAAGCESTGNHGPQAAAGAQPERVVDAGPASKYTADGVYDGFRDLGFFVLRKGGKLCALSAYCTHRKCKLTAEPDHSFYCQCHGSTFDPTGKVTEGPASRDLPVFPMTPDASGHLLVKVPAV
jgi:Rieske Fe-S protein